MKIVSIHQPQYIPWLPYFMKVEESQTFVILDSVDFQKNGLQNRNQIKTANGPAWLTVPVYHKLGQKIVDVKINNKIDWRKKHCATLLQNYSRADEFANYLNAVKDVYAKEWLYLSELNIHLMKLMLKWLGIESQIFQSSAMNVKGSGSELILNICLELGANQYLSGIGGNNYLDENSFREAGVEVIYRPPELPVLYKQQHQKIGFLNDLSAIDIIFNCGDRWRDYIKKEAIDV